MCCRRLRNQGKYAIKMCDVCEDSDTLTLTFSDRFAYPLELLQTPWIDGREHADHDSGIYFTLHLIV